MLHRLSRDIAIYGASDFAFKLIAFATFPIFAHALTVEEYGVMSLVMTATSLLALVGGTGINNAVQRYYWDPATDADTRPRVVSTGLALQLLSGAAVVAAALWTSYLVRGLFEDRYGISWAIAAVAVAAVVPELIAQYSLDTVRLHFAPWRFAAISFLKNLLGVLLALALVLGFGAGVFGVFLGNAIAVAAAVPVALWFIRKDLRVTFDREWARKLFRFGYPFVFAGLAYWMFVSIDRWMLAEMANQTEVGLYSIGAKLASMIVFVNAAFGQAWSPMAIRTMSERKDYRTLFGRLLSAWLFGLTLLGGAVGIFSPEILRLLTPPEYWAAGITAAFLTAGTVLSGTTQITAVGISIARQTRLFAVSAWITAALNVLLNLLLIPPFGAGGAAAATLASHAVLTSLYLYWSQSLHPIVLEKGKLVFSLTCLGAFVGLALILNGESLTIGMFALKLGVLGLALAIGQQFGVIPRVGTLFSSVLGPRNV